jgi:formylglycine-generating enzyme required for sulfatase activity
MKTIQHIALLAAGLLAASSATAAIKIDTVQVGNKGYGGVDYDYHIGTYEVTNSQYTAFLNATAATDNHSLYNSNMGSSIHGGINREGSSGHYTYSVKSGFGDKPVNFVSFWDAARFSNWLTTGDTEDGVYDLGGTTLPTNTTIIRDATAWAHGGVAVASENEWFKAAYYDGNDSYTTYPTNSDSITKDDAHYGDSEGTVTNVGTYDATSYYGTYDQGGNVWEWCDTIASPLHRGLRGGSYFSSSASLRATILGVVGKPDGASGGVGFRVSSLEPIPEPSAYAAILGCLGLALALMRRKGRGAL